MTLPYQKHSETSKQAAERNTTAANIRSEVLDIIINSHFEGCISDEIAEMMDKVPNIIASRLQELETAGLVVRLEATRKTRSKRNANIYVGRNYVEGRDTLAPKKSLNQKDTENLARQLMQLIRENSIILGSLDKIRIERLAEKAGI